jgi:hypothetical protein
LIVGAPIAKMKARVRGELHLPPLNTTILKKLKVKNKASFKKSIEHGLQHAVKRSNEPCVKMK